MRPERAAGRAEADREGIPMEPSDTSVRSFLAQACVERVGDAVRRSRLRGEAFRRLFWEERARLRGVTLRIEDLLCSDPEMDHAGWGRT